MMVMRVLMNPDIRNPLIIMGDESVKMMVVKGVARCVNMPHWESVILSQLTSVGAMSFLSVLFQAIRMGLYAQEGLAANAGNPVLIQVGGTSMGSTSVCVSSILIVVENRLAPIVEQSVNGMR